MIAKDDVWTVVGSGMGGKGILAALALQGLRVRAHDIVEAKIDGIRSSGGLHVEGRSRTFAPIELATTDLRLAVRGAKVVIVSTYGNDHPAVARALAPLLEDGQLVLLMLGHFGGTLAFQKALDDHGCKARIEVAEFDGFPYMLAVLAPNRVEMQTTKNYYRLATISGRKAGLLAQELKFAFPGLCSGKNVLQTGFDDFGGILHTGAVITNVGRVESGTSYNFYAATMTPSVCNLIEAMDRERIAVANAYDVATPTVQQWLKDTYNANGTTLSESLRQNALTHYRSSPAPNSLHHRFFMTDVPCFLVPVSSLAHIANVPTPVIDSMIMVANALVSRDFVREGRNLLALGLDNKSIAEINHFIN